MALPRHERPNYSHESGDSDEHRYTNGVSHAMIVALVLSVLGILMGIVVVQWYGLRLSGVLVVPLFAVYALYDFVAVPAFLLAGACAYVGVSALRKRTFLFGRQLLLAAMAIGAAVPLCLFVPLSAVGAVSIELSALTVVGSILPGVAAYNYHQLDDRAERIDDLIASTAAFVGLVGLGVALINVSFAPTLGRIVPPFLFTPEADVAAIRQATISDIEAGLGASTPVLLLTFAIGVLGSEGVYHRWGVRLTGIVALPLLALFALQSAVVVPIYVAGLGIVYLLTTEIHRRTLLYGRVLLGISIVVGMFAMLPVAIVAPVAPGVHLFFTAVLTGVGAYNLHRVPPAHRRNTMAISAGLFVVLLFWLRLFVSPSSNGALYEPTVPTLTLALAGVLAGTVAIYRLERLELPAGNRRIAATNPSA